VCQLIKVDAEGFGGQVLKGMLETVLRCRPVVAAECNSVEEAAELLQSSHWPDYKCHFLRTSAFNPDNFNKQTHNSFGVATETTLLFVPNELASLTPVSCLGAEILAVSGLDDIASLILASPRYGDRSAYDRDPVHLLAALIEAEELKTRVEFRNAALTAQYWQTNKIPRNLAAGKRLLKSCVHRAARFLKLRSS
jgi:hypothetical protein